MTSARSVKIFSTLPPQLQKAAPSIALVLAVFAVYANTFGNAFLYDDETLIVNNQFLQHWHFLPAIFATSADAGANVASSYYRPLQILLYFIVYQMAGLSLFGFHFLNIALHATNACLLYALGRKLNFNPWAVFCAVLIWALHPVQTEVVAYISGAADPLYVFFCLCGLLILLPDFTPRKFFLVIPIFILGLLSKEEALTFPLLVMSCIFLLDKKRFQIKPYIRTWPLWPVTGAYMILRRLLHIGLSSAQPPHISSLAASNPYFGPPPYTFFATLPDYFKILIWPTHLHFERSFPFFSTPWHFQVLAGLAIFGLAAWQILWRQKPQNLPLSWGLLWFIAAYSLHTDILFITDTPFYEHWMYLPSAGLFMGIAQTLALQAGRHPAMAKHGRMWAVSAGFLAAAFAWETTIQNRVWRDADSLYGNVFANGETSPHAHNNMGVAYASRGEYQQALDQFRLAIQFSGDSVAEAQYNFAATLLLERNDKSALREAIPHLLRALEIDPDYYAAHMKLADCYNRLGNKSQAAQYRHKAEEIHKKFTPSGL